MQDDRYIQVSVINRVDQWGGGGGVVVYQYARKKVPKIPKIFTNIPKIERDVAYVYIQNLL